MTKIKDEDTTNEEDMRHMNLVLVGDTPLICHRFNPDMHRGCCVFGRKGLVIRPCWVT